MSSRGSLVAALLFTLAPLASLASLAACVSPPPKMATRTPVTTPEPAGPPPVPAVCVIHSDRWSSHPELRLALYPGGPPFAEVFDDSKDITLTVDDAGARVDITTGRLELHGFVEPRNLEVYPARAFDLAGIAVPDLGNMLEWSWRGKAGHLQIAAAMPSVLEIERAPALAAPRPCSDLALDVGRFDAFDALGGRGLARPAMLRSGARVALSPRPDAAPVAHAALKPAQTEPVIVIAEQKDRAHIAWRHGALLLHGWVSASELVPGTEPLRQSIFISTNADNFNWPRPLRTLTCPGELELLASRGGAPKPVGRVLAGAAVGVLDEAAPLTAVRIMDSGALAAEGAKLLMNSKDLAGCAAATWP